MWITEVVFFSLLTRTCFLLLVALCALVLRCLLIRLSMKSVKLYIHFLWMFLLTVLVANSQSGFNPSGYASSLKDALKEPSSISTLSVYYTRGMIFNVEQGRDTPDEPFEKLSELNNLRNFRLNGCPINFNQETFFCSIGNAKQLESLEIRMNFKHLGLLTEPSLKCLKKLKNLKKLHLPSGYPSESYIKLQQLLPNCEIIINLSVEPE